MTKIVVDNMPAIPAGAYRVIHKQRNPLWYATDSYFTSRNLPLPPEGDLSRYRRGAYGDFALFIDKDLPIHSGIIWTEEVGGIKLNDNEMSKIYYLLPLDAAVEIK